MRDNPGPRNRRYPALRLKGARSKQVSETLHIYEHSNDVAVAAFRGDLEIFFSYHIVIHLKP